MGPISLGFWSLLGSIVSKDRWDGGHSSIFEKQKRIKKQRELKNIKKKKNTPPPGLLPLLMGPISLGFWSLLGSIVSKDQWDGGRSSIFEKQKRIKKH
jgi:hypothetical protein